MDFAAVELMDELTHVDALMREATRRAGKGFDPQFERQLDACLRSLRSMLGHDDFIVASDTIEAAKRVVTAADPQAPLAMLAMAHRTLAGVLRRRATNIFAHETAITRRSAPPSPLAA